MSGDWRRIGMENEEKSFGELPTLGRTEEAKSAGTPQSGPSWSSLGLSEAETLKPPEGIVDDGRTDRARRWKAGETILGRYVVERELGEGGMGVVYECLDTGGGVKVAVKSLPPEVGRDRDEMEEVRENFRLVYKLSHPNIAGVRVLEKDGRGEYHLVMELAEGDSLRRWSRQKRKGAGVSLEEAIPVLLQVATALDYAHSEKVIHRDVKPGNIMVDAKGRVKVLDFGLAAQIRTSMSRVSRDVGRTSGTRPYMAPEQWEGQPQDARTDQYALGVTAYELLAGRLPFEGDDTEVLRSAVLHGRVRDIEGVGFAQMADLRRALAKEPKKRFATCREFVAALAGERAAKPPTTEPRKENARDVSGGDVFLRKVRLGKELDAAGKNFATHEEQTALAGIREIFAAGEEALRVRQNHVAEELFAEAEESLATWRKWQESRLEKERKEAEKRQELLKAIEEHRRKAEEEQERLRRENEVRGKKKAEAQRKREQAEENRLRQAEEERRRKEAQNWVRKSQAEVIWGRKKELSRRIQELEEQFLQAEQLNLTQNEQVSLADIRALFEDGYKAFRVGLDEKAEVLFTQAEGGLATWWKWRETRLDTERKEEEKRRTFLKEIEERRRKAEGKQERLRRQEEQRRRAMAEAQRQREQAEAERRQSEIEAGRQWGRRENEGEADLQKVANVFCIIIFLFFFILVVLL